MCENIVVRWTNGARTLLPMSLRRGTAALPARGRVRRPAAILLLVALLTVLGFSRSALAAGVYTAGTNGYDFSSPQCSLTLPGGPYAFGIVGVDNGRAFRHNSCLANEFGSVFLASGNASLYMNLNYAIGSTGSYGNNGPAGKCSGKDQACQAYNYGYNAAQDAFQYADSQSASSSTWWIDIETYNSWSAKPNLNDQVIQGSIDFFVQKGLTVGVYSTQSMWNKIMGSAFVPNMRSQGMFPNWVAGGGSQVNAPNLCNSQYAFGGGSVWLVQYSNGNFDGDYAC